MKLSDFLKTYYGIPEVHKNKRLRYLCESVKNFSRAVLEEYIDQDELILAVDQSKICELFKYNRKSILNFLFLGYCYCNQRGNKNFINRKFKKNIWYRDIDLKSLISYSKYDDFINLYSFDKLLYYFFKDPIIINTKYQLLPFKDRYVDAGYISEFQVHETTISVSRFNRILEKYKWKRNRGEIGKYFIYHEKNTKLPEKDFFERNGYRFIEE